MEHSPNNENKPEKNPLEKSKNGNEKIALIIDDDKWTRTLLARFLKEFKIHSLEADNPYTGIALSTREKPDMIFLDIFLPEINGDKILKILKEIDLTKLIPVVMVSGNFNKELLHDTYTRGAAGFISKPFNREIVKDILDRCLFKSEEDHGPVKEWVKEL
jgi:DNA-binding NtrC family response regulator